MFSRRLKWLTATGNGALLRDGLRGVEKETLRVTPAGTIAQTPHPKTIGSPLTHPSITTDYSEALLEIVTPPYSQNWPVVQLMCDLHAFLNENVGDELLWPLSMPCLLGDDDAIPIANYGPSNSGMLRTVYRRGLGHRYGRSMQAIAGVHFNYSPPESFWTAYSEHERESSNLREFRSAQLMALVRNYNRYAWLVIYLFGASPAFSKSFLPAGNALVESWDKDTWYAPYATSLRMSDLGYQNKSQARLQISVNSLAEYIEGLTSAITTQEPKYEVIGVKSDGEYKQLNSNVLQIENEYYSTIRPKPSKKSTRTTIGLREGGVEYVEVRTLDLSPADPIGMNQSQLRFLEVLLVYCLLEESPPITPAEQEKISARNLSVAREGRKPGLTVPDAGGSASLSELAMLLQPKLLAVASLLDDGTQHFTDSVTNALNALRQPEHTPSAKLLVDMREEGVGFVEHGIGLALRHREYFRQIGLDNQRRATLEREAVQSWADARKIESADTRSFDAFLAEFLNTV